MIRTHIGSEVGDAATCSVRSDEVSWLTISRHQNCAPRYEVNIFLLYILSLSLFGVLFSWFSGSFWVQLYILD